MALEKQITQMPASIKDAPFLRDPRSFHQHAEVELRVKRIAREQSFLHPRNLRSNENHALVPGSLPIRIFKMNSKN